MAVRADRQRQGIGRMLISELEEILIADGRRVLVALTVSPSDGGPEPPDGYQATRAFYRSAGFVLARDLKNEWGSDTAVMMIRSVGPGA